MKPELKDFSKILKDFKQILASTDIEAFQLRDKSKPLKKIKNQYLSPELIYLYNNYQTLLILPHIHIVSYHSLFPKKYSIDKGRTFQEYMPWENGKVIFAYSYNNNYEKIWVDPKQKNNPIYVTDNKGNFKLMTSSINIFFQLLIELCISYNMNSHREPKCSSSLKEWTEFRENIVSPYFYKKIKKIINDDTIEIITQVFTLN